jgi:hypothetical protein
MVMKDKRISLFSFVVLSFFAISAFGDEVEDRRKALLSPKATLAERTKAISGIESLQEAEVEDGPFERVVLPFFRSKDIPIRDKVALFTSEQFQKTASSLLEGEWDKHPSVFVAHAEITRPLYSDPNLGQAELAPPKSAV